MRVILISALALLFGSACASSGDAAGDSPPSGGSSSGGTGSELRSLAFLDARSDLSPRDELTLTVQASPPGAYWVRFSLPSSGGSDPKDAVLDRSEAQTDEQGLASVLLLAPSSAAHFSVRASAEGRAAERELDVTDDGTATIVVEPIYTGKRMVMTWVASARREATCAGAVIPPPDGEYKGFAASDSLPEIVGVPANVPLAITLRSGHYIGGCASVEGFPAGPKDQHHRVKVTVLDRPIELLSSHLSLSFSLAEADTAFAELTQAAGAAALVAMLGSSTDDADALLDTMRANLQGDDRQALDLARKGEGWDDLVRQHWGAGAATRLRDRVSSWLTGGMASLANAPSLLEGALEPVDARSAELTLSLLAGLPPEQAGLVSPALVSWSADADDTVGLGTDLYFSSSRLATGLAEPLALEDFPDAVSAPSALSLALECEALAELLTAAGSDDAVAYAGCDADCLNERCSSAVETIWQRGRDVSSSKPARLSLSATGGARVGDAAEIAGFRGDWVGELTGNDFARSTSGELSVTQSAP